MDTEKIYQTYNEYYHIPSMRDIDIVLSMPVSRKLEGRRVWMLLVGESGVGKTVLTKPLTMVENNGEQIVHQTSELTPNTITSGRPDKIGIAEELDGKIWYIPDFSTVITKRSEDQRKIYSQMRNLYDGFAKKETGMPGDVKEFTPDVTLLSCVTPAIYDHILVRQDLGTRFLLYRLNSDEKWERMKKSFDEEEMDLINQNIANQIQLWMRNLDIEKPELTKEDKEKIMHIADWTARMRAEGKTDRYTGELASEVIPEMPTRLVKQLRNMFYSLWNVRKDIKKAEIFSILWQIAESSVDPLKQKIHDYVKEDDGWCTLYQIKNTMKVGRKTVKSRCQTLWNVDLFERDEDEEDQTEMYKYNKTEYKQENLGDEE